MECATQAPVGESSDVSTSFPSVLGRQLLLSCLHAEGRHMLLPTELGSRQR